MKVAAWIVLAAAIGSSLAAAYAKFSAKRSLHDQIDLFLIGAAVGLGITAILFEISSP